MKTREPILALSLLLPLLFWYAILWHIKRKHCWDTYACFMFLVVSMVLNVWSFIPIAVKVSPRTAPPTSEGNSWLFSYSLLHYAHMLIANVVCVLCGAGQLVYSGVSELCLCLLWPGNNTYDTVPAKVTVKLSAGKPIQCAKRAQSSVELRETVECGDIWSVGLSLQVTPFTYKYLIYC